MKIWSILEKIIVVIIKVFAMIFFPLRELSKFIHTFLTQKFRKNLKLALLVLGGLLLVVVLLVIFQPIIGWLAELRDNEIPSDITSSYRQPEQGFDPTLQPKPRIGKIDFSEEFLDGGDTNQLSITIWNEGSGDAGNLTIELRLFTNPKDLKREVSFPKTTEVPTIPKEGVAKTVVIDIKGSDELSNGRAEIKSYLLDSNFRRIYPIKPFKFRTRKLATPKLALGEWAVKGVATDKTDIHLYEDIKLEFYVHNNSNVEARDIKVQVKNSQDGVLSLEKTDESANHMIIFTYKNINKNNPKLISHRYSTNLNFEDSKLKFEITATTENNSKYGFKKTIKHSINRKIKPQGQVTIETNDDESPLHEKQKGTKTQSLKPSGNRWIYILLIILFVCVGLCFVYFKWYRKRKIKNTQKLPHIRVR